MIKKIFLIKIVMSFLINVIFAENSRINGLERRIEYLENKVEKLENKTQKFTDIFDGKPFDCMAFFSVLNRSKSREFVFNILRIQGK